MSTKLHAKVWTFSVTLVALLLCSMSQVFGQQTKISGQVLDETGMGLPGASVLLKGTNNGTVTDLDGNFQLTFESKENPV